MSYPTAEQLTSWADTLTRTNWTKLASRLATAIDRDRRGGSAIPDGFPGAGGNGTGGHSGFVIDDENGDPEFVSATAVELVAFSLDHARDEHHDRTRRAVTNLEQTVTNLAALVTQLDRIEARVVHADGHEPGCAHHAQFSLREERYRGDLCRCCYDFKAEFGVLPTADLVDDRARGIKWNSARISRSLAGVRL